MQSRAALLWVHTMRADRTDSGTSPDNAPDITRSARVLHLLDVSRKAFIANGFDAVSIDAIARDSGVSKQTIYRYFPDKQALFQAATEAIGTQYSTRAYGAHQSGDEPALELVQQAAMILDSAIEGGLMGANWVAIGVARTMPEFAEGLLDDQWRRLEPVRETLTAYARSAGSGRQVPLDMAIDFGSLAAEGPVLLMGFPRPSPEHRAVIARRAASLFCRGIGYAIEEDAGDVQTLARWKQATDHVAPGSQSPHIRKLLMVAADHFLSQGYSGANLETICSEASVGRGTLYRHFSNKDGLFAAAMRDCANTIVNEAHTSMPLLPQPIGAANDLDDLTNFLDTAAASLTSPRAIALHRTVIAESQRDPETARCVFTQLRAPWLTALEHWLEGLLPPNITSKGDTAWFAHAILLLAHRGNRLFVSNKPLSDAARLEHARKAATIALSGFVKALES